MSKLSASTLVPILHSTNENLAIALKNRTKSVIKLFTKVLFTYFLKLDLIYFVRDWLTKQIYFLVRSRSLGINTICNF